MKKSSVIVAFFCVLTLVLVLAVSCKTSSTNSTDSTSKSSNDSRQQVLYEGVFIDDTQAVLDIINKLRGEQEPYEHLKENEFHVTVAFEPNNPMLDKLGTKFEVHIVGYDRELIKTEEVEAYSEALRVQLHTDDAELQQYITENGMNWHITCSYSYMAMYSMYMDFSDAEAVDYVVSGTSGAYFGDGVYAFSTDQL